MARAFAASLKIFLHLEVISKLHRQADENMKSYDLWIKGRFFFTEQ